jgi:peptide/nickel transport system substrate-binding protein
MPHSDSDMVNRRKLMQGLGTITGIGLAGCSSSEDDSDNSTETGPDGGSGELGERVPQITLSYWADMGGEYTVPMESGSSVISESLGKIGLDVEITPMGLSSSLGDILGDERKANLAQFGHSFSAARLDPGEFLSDNKAQLAFSEGPNWSKYVNCEFTDLVNQANKATDREERQELVNQTQELYSSEVGTIPLTNKVLFWGANDRIDVKGGGLAGITGDSPYWMMLSEVNEGENVIKAGIAPGFLERIIPTNANGNQILASVLNSPLRGFTPDLEPRNVLASNVEVSEDGLAVTVELKDGIQFQNGDPITAEDVAWSYNYYFSNLDLYPHGVDVPWAEELQLEEPWGPIDVVDDKTVVFNFAEKYPVFTARTMNMWGILHSESWREQGAAEGGSEFDPDPHIGSGPMEIADFQPGREMRLTPTEVEHPIFNPSHDLVLIGFQDAASETQALKAGEIDLVMERSSGSFVEEMEQVDNINTAGGETLGIMTIYPQHQFGPQKFLELRKAISVVIDREKWNQLAYRGSATPQFASTLFMKTESDAHPWRPPENRLSKFTTNPSGDPEKAKQILRDAGWSWDDNGNLHYPPDADLEPKWPKGGDPEPDQFACLDGEGNYVPPGDR